MKRIEKSVLESYTMRLEDADSGDAIEDMLTKLYVLIIEVGGLICERRESA